MDIAWDDVYDPGEDTLLLLKAAMREARPEDLSLEIGCGRCLISKKVAPLVRRHIATDVNPNAVAIARESGLAAVRADLFRGIKGRFDLILFNPPYLPTEEDEKLEGWINYAYDGGATGRETIDRFLEGLGEHLSSDGRALLLVSSADGLDEVEEKIASTGLSAKQVGDGPEMFFFERLYVFRVSVAHKWGE